MTSCSGGSSELPNFINEDETVDLTGYNFTLMETTDSDSSGTLISEDNPLGYPATTLLADKVLARFSDIKEALSCDIELSLNSDSAVDLVYSIISDSMDCEAVFSAAHQLFDTVARGGGLLPVEDYGEYVDYTNVDKYGGANIMEVNSYNGKMYGLSPVSWVYKQPRSVSLLVVNMDLVNRYGRQNPREFLENGTWSWDALEQLIDDYYYEEGDTVIYSLAARYFDFIKLSALGNGVSMTYYDDSGNLATDYGSQAMIDAITWSSDIMKKYESHIQFGIKDVDWEDVTNSFTIDFKSMMCLTAPSVLYNDVIYKVEDYAVLPFPTGPNGVYGQWPATIEAAECFGVFTSAMYPEAAFKIIDMICEPLEGMETADDRLSFLSTNAFYDRSDAETVLNIHKYGVYSYWANTKIDDFWRACDTDLLTATPAKTIESYKDLVSTIIAEEITPNLEIYSYFGGK